MLECILRPDVLVPLILSLGLLPTCFLTVKMRQCLIKLMFLKLTADCAYVTYKRLAIYRHKEQKVGTFHLNSKYKKCHGRKDFSYSKVSSLIFYFADKSLFRKMVRENRSFIKWAIDRICDIYSINIECLHVQDCCGKDEESPGNWGHDMFLEFVLM